MDTYFDGRPMRQSFYVWRDRDGWQTPVFSLNNGNLVTLAWRAWHALHPNLPLSSHALVTFQTIDHCTDKQQLLDAVYLEIQDRIDAGMIEIRPFLLDLQQHFQRPHQMRLFL